MSEVLGGLGAKVAGEISHPLLDERGDQKYLIVLISADKGLAGAFNANVIKAAHAFLKENDGKVDGMIAIGRKGRDFFKRRQVEMRDEYIGLMGGQVNYADAAGIAHDLIKTFTEDTSIDKVFIVFTEFKTVLSQKPVIEQLLPIRARRGRPNCSGFRPNTFTSSRPPRSSASSFQNRSKLRSTKG